MDANTSKILHGNEANSNKPSGILFTFYFICIKASIRNAPKPQRSCFAKPSIGIYIGRTDFLNKNFRNFCVTYAIV